MSTLIPWYNLQVVTPEPAVSGGKAINDNFKILSTPVTAADPGMADDDLHGFAIGSRWYNTTSNVEWICTNAATGGAVWIKVAGNPFNQSLNTSDSPTFAGLALTGAVDMGGHQINYDSSTSLKGDGSGNIDFSSTSRDGAINLGGQNLIVGDNHGDGAIFLGDSVTSGSGGQVLMQGGSIYGGLGSGTGGGTWYLEGGSLSQVNDLAFNGQSSDPSSPSAGEIYYNSTTHTLKYYNNTTWVTLSSNTFSTGLTNASGTVTSNISTGVSGGQTIYGGTGSTDSLIIDSTTNGTKGAIVLNPTSGNVGINISSPSYPLHVKSASGIGLMLDSTDGIFDVGSSTGAIRIYGGDYYFAGPSLQVWPTGSAAQGLYFDAGSASGADINFRVSPNGANSITVKQSTGFAGFGGLTSPSAMIHLASGTSSIAPLKLTSGTSLATPADGTFEYDGTHLYFTIGSTRHTLI